MRRFPLEGWRGYGLAFFCSQRSIRCKRSLCFSRRVRHSAGVAKLPRWMRRFPLPNCMARFLTTASKPSSSRLVAATSLLRSVTTPLCCDGAPCTALCSLGARPVKQLRRLASGLASHPLRHRKGRPVKATFAAPRASRPISRVLSWATIHLGRPSPSASSGLPEPGADHATGLLFGLAPGGVCLAADVAVERGALLPHPFTLTANATFTATLAAVCFLLHFPWARAPQALPGALSCGARTFLCAG